MDKNEIRILVTQRISSLGFDDISLNSFDFAFDKAKEIILARTNQDEVPDSLRYALVDMTAGYLLDGQKFSGISLGGKELGIDAENVKSITEGDISVNFASASDGVKTPEKLFDEIVDKLINQPKELFYKHRRLLW